MAIGKADLALPQRIHVIVESDLSGCIVDEMNVDFAAGLQSLDRDACEAKRGGKRSRDISAVNRPSRSDDQAVAKRPRRLRAPWLVDSNRCGRAPAPKDDGMLSRCDLIKGAAVALLTLSIQGA